MLGMCFNGQTCCGKQQRESGRQKTALHYPLLLLDVWFVIENWCRQTHSACSHSPVLIYYTRLAHCYEICPYPGVRFPKVGELGGDHPGSAGGTPAFPGKPIYLQIANTPRFNLNSREH